MPSIDSQADPALPCVPDCLQDFRSGYRQCQTLPLDPLLLRAYRMGEVEARDDVWRRSRLGNLPWPRQNTRDRAQWAMPTMRIELEDWPGLAGSPRLPPAAGEQTRMRRVL